MRRFFTRLAAGALAAAAVPAAASAQGYGVYEQSACPSGRAGTGVAAASCQDGSAIFYNPAAIVGLGRQVVSVGSSVIAPIGSFTNRFSGVTTDLEDKIYPIPHAYYVRPFGSENRWAAGIGVFAPYGLATDWPETFEGRFLGYHSSIRAIYIQPTVAHQVTDRLSLGAGVDIVPVHVALYQRVDLADVPTPAGPTFGQLGFASGTDVADVRLEGSTISFGAHVGVQYRVSDAITLGARYLVRQRPEIDEGEAEIRQIETGLTLAPNNPLGLPGGTPLDVVLAPQFDETSPTAAFVTQGGSTSIPLPDQLVLGLQWRATDRARFLFDYQFTNWSTFEALVIDFERLGERVIREDYEEAHGFRFGGEYDFSPTTTGRIGYYRHTRAAPPQTVTPNLPTGERASVTVGIGTRLTQSLGLEAYYQYIDQPDRQGRTIDGPNNGLYEFNAHLVGATFALTF